jgi:hypothetical protein
MRRVQKCRLSNSIGGVEKGLVAEIVRVMNLRTFIIMRLACTSGFRWQGIEFIWYLCNDGNISKERITVVLACSAIGPEKHPPLVTARTEKPYCFRNNRRFPNVSNKKAWVRYAVLTDYLRVWYGKMCSQNRKIILFVGQCVAYSKNAS